MCGRIVVMESATTSSRINTATTLSIISLVVSLISLGGNLYFSEHNDDLNKRAAVRENIRVYLSAYSDTIISNDQFSPDGYRRLSPKDQTRVGIVDGMLASVVDAMNWVGDPRADLWGGYLKSIDGPVANGFHLEAYAIEPKTLKIIEQIRKTAAAPARAR
jgi:hypothetical protein